MQDFGLDVENFQQMVGDCPSDFLDMAISCCNVRISAFKVTELFFILLCFIKIKIIMNELAQQLRKYLLNEQKAFK